ncbi:MAG: hypothetical protein GY792_20450 [Gammaproteobacteria bacterium]|nr:hypothetical protein [Gammaproteobacteria bacterium]
MTLLLFVTALLPLSLPEADADTLLIDAVESAPSNSDNGVRRPGRGLSMEHVRRLFGEPDSILSPVGDPPITRWIYGSFTVYFEHQLAITSVINR